MINKIEYTKRLSALKTFIKLRQRQIFTRSNRLRARYAVALSAVFGVALGAYIIPTTLSGTTDFSLPSMTFAQNSANGVDEDNSANVSSGIRKAAASIKKPPMPLYEEVSVQSGNTIAGILQEKGLSGEEAYHAVEALSEHFDPRKIRAGQVLSMNFKRDGKKGRKFESMNMQTNSITEITVKFDSKKNAVEQQFAVMVEREELQSKMRVHAAEVKSSLYGSAEKAGIPARVIGNVIRTYSWNVDFQRDIRPGDKIEVMYETKETDDGRVIETGNVVYARLNIGNRDLPIYRYKKSDGFVDYFGADGHNLKKVLMKTPIDGARMSSGFGMRRHPVLGYNKMHKGVDFAAPTGTPIYAAGNGTISYAGRKGGYGNYISIRHNGKLTTAYAHMHKFARGMKSGKRIKQGDIIGYVGTTGRSTGPHLHYEVLVNGKHANPRSVNLPTGEQLTGNELKRFKAHMRSLNQRYAALKNGVKVASSDGHPPKSKRAIH